MQNAMIRYSDALVNSRKRKMRRTAVKRSFHYLLLAVIAVTLMFPFLVMVTRSFMKIDDIYAARIFPTHWTLGNYSAVLMGHDYFKYAFNTLKVVVFNVLAVPLSAALCAYSFAKLKWKGREFAFAAVLATIMIPGTVVQIPLYVLFFDLGWLGTLLPLTIPSLFGGGAINIFLIRQFMRGIPKEMDEAAIIDGASIMRRFFKIVLPLCGPILIYVAVGAFSASWSDFFGPLVYLTGYHDKYTLAVAIYEDSVLNSVLETSNLKMAAGVFMSVFPLLLFALYQRKLVDGIMIGAVKG